MTTQMRLLLVDSQGDEEASLARLLRSLGHVVAAVEVSNAKWKVAQFQPDLVLLHLGPPSRGWEARARFVRSDRPDLALVGLTAWDPQAFRGCDFPILQKPVRLEALLLVLGQSARAASHAERVSQELARSGCP